jgi:hypothetical protein
MGVQMERSIDHAIKLLGTPQEYDKYLSIKLSPPSGCCCSHCWPETWRAVNSHISPYGPVDHEGDAAIGDGDDKYVLESHESGPEIIAYIALATASTTLAKSIIDLITTFVKSLSKEHRKQPPRIRISKRQLIKGDIEEETLMEVDIPISKESQKQIEDRIKKLMNL